VTRRLLVILASAACSTRTGVGGGPIGTPTAHDQIAAENALPGTKDWVITNPALQHEIEGYVGEPSFAPGATVRVQVSTNPPAGYSWRVFRSGWYGGLGGREVAHGGPLAGTTQAAFAFDQKTGLIEAHWKPSFHFSTHGWTTGVYLVELTTDAGKQSYAVFVLTDPTRDADIALQLPVTTWQAYNDWGGDSLYTSTHGLGKAVEVSYDRPYTSDESNGAGLYPSKEYPLVSWLEQHGYDVGYRTPIDTTVGVGQPKLFITVGHDEYATLEEMNNLETARDASTSEVYLTGDTFYWQIRFDRSTGTLRQICYKNRITDDPDYGVDDAHVSTEFRLPPVNRPENALLGVMSSGEAQDALADWIVQSSSHWVYDNTGLHDGDAIPSLVGYEWDSLQANGAAPANLVVLASSPVSNETQNATIYETAHTFVFAAGTIDFDRGLTGPASQILTNLITRAGIKGN
jgi:hypothetical protein